MTTHSLSTIRTPFADVRVTSSADGILVEFTGELDHGLAEPFRLVPALVQASGLPVQVDLSDVTFFGAWAVRALLSLRAAAAPGAFTVRADSEPVRSTLVTLGLTTLAPGASAMS